MAADEVSAVQPSSESAAFVDCGAGPDCATWERRFGQFAWHGRVIRENATAHRCLESSRRSRRYMRTGDRQGTRRKSLRRGLLARARSELLCPVSEATSL